MVVSSEDAETRGGVEKALLPSALCAQHLIGYVLTTATHRDIHDAHVCLRSLANTQSTPESEW